MTARTATTDTVLDRIVADKREELEALAAKEPLERLKERALAADAPIPFAPALAGPQLHLIAEIKKASPSKGILDRSLEPLSRARTYTLGGAAAISVLTETKSFLGSLDHITAIRVGVDRYYPGLRPPLLRKDFLFDPYHLYEARAAGADAVLLIAAILPDGPLVELLSLARELSLGALVEVHTEEELERVLRTDAEVIGINNRDLRTFVTDLAVTERLRPMIPAGRVVVSESGIHTREDAERVRALGVDAVLVGEALMTSENVIARMKEYMV
jgi:indole-3-glycerol phosphate synthase